MSSFGGDQIIQHGSHNIGKQTWSSGQLSDADRLQAIAELAAFMQFLTNSGAVTAAGQVSEHQVIAAARSNAPRLGAVLTALRSGAERVLVTALDHVATPVVLHLIQGVRA